MSKFEIGDRVQYKEDSSLTGTVIGFDKSEWVGYLLVAWDDDASIFHPEKLKKVES